jgi:hypothetical protein
MKGQEMTKSKTVNVNLMGMPNLLTILFVYLKLTHQIDWSWWWVTAPSWIPLAIFFGLLGFMAVMAVLAAILK